MNTEFLQATQEINPAILNTEVDPVVIKSRLRKALPFIIGAASAIAGTLLIRAWIQHARNEEVEEVEEPIDSSPAISAKAIAFQLLPFATLFLKSWLTRNKKENAEVTDR